jgi:uncharacterized protein (TIGR01777 family)
LRIFVTGGTGFVGSALVRALVERGDDAVVLTRSDRPAPKGVTYLRGDPRTEGSWQGSIDGCDAVVNLAGTQFIHPLHRWTDARKALLRTSRVDVTRMVAATIRAASTPPQVLVSASAVGIYGDRGDVELDESATKATDFLGTLATDWESAAFEAEPATRVVTIRSGIVLGSGGMLSTLLPLFKLGLGGAWGSGDQWLSWIHLVDEVGLILFLIAADLSGPVNLVAPHPVRVTRFARAIGGAHQRPTIFKAPALGLRLALGEAASALLASQRVVPRKAINAGYEFRFREVEAALEDLA